MKVKRPSLDGYVHTRSLRLISAQIRLCQHHLLPVRFLHYLLGGKLRKSTLLAIYGLALIIAIAARRNLFGFGRCALRILCIRRTM